MKCGANACLECIPILRNNVNEIQKYGVNTGKAGVNGPNDKATRTRGGSIINFRELIIYLYFCAGGNASGAGNL